MILIFIIDEKKFVRNKIMAYRIFENIITTSFLLFFILIAFSLFTFLMIQVFKRNYVKVNPFVASDIPDWSDMAMEYNYLE